MASDIKKKNAEYLGENLLEPFENYYTKVETDTLLNSKTFGITFSIEPPSNSEGKDEELWIQYPVEESNYYTADEIDQTVNLQNGDIIDCLYSAERQELTLPPGTYKLRCWGAQGGDSNDNTGGPGGYSSGHLTLTQTTTLYLYVGGAGSIANTTGVTVAGGFNGGGASRIGNDTYTCGSGGGATDIRIGQDSLYARVIVAGGGGGAGYESKGGVGGGVSGLQGENSGGNPGTQNAAGVANSSNNATTASFGVGSGSNNTATNGTMIAGGGGGWYGGAHHNAATTSTRGGGGGSGYVYTKDTASNYPSGCLLNSDYYLTNASTADGSLFFTDMIGNNVQGNYGCGYIRIVVEKLD